MQKWESCCVLRIAEREVTLALRHPEAARYFGDYVCDFPPGADPVHVPEAAWRAWLDTGGRDDAYGEYTCSTAAVSDALLRDGCCILHAGAFRFGPSAWLIAGQPSAGKSTQMRNLRGLDPGEFDVICGDRPALELRGDGTAFVHPSPWNGKENWKGAAGAPLAGLIVLERGDANAFSSLTAREAVLPLLNSLILTRETEENIRQMARFADSFLSRVPVYRLVSCTVPDSSRLLYDSLFRER